MATAQSNDLCPWRVQDLPCAVTLAQRDVAQFLCNRGIDPATRRATPGGVDLGAVLAGKAGLDLALPKDPATGIATIIAVEPATKPLSAGEATRLLSEAAKRFEFILVIGKALADPTYSGALAALADKEIFAVTAAEAPGVAAVLGQKLSGPALSRAATVIVEYGSERAEPRAAPRSAVLQSAIAELRRTNRFAELN